MTRVPVERLRVGAVVVLPNNRRVRVDEVVHYPEDGVYIIGWSRPQATYRDGFPIAGGRMQGSLRPLRAGDKVDVDETARAIEEVNVDLDPEPELSRP